MYLRYQTLRNATLLLGFSGCLAYCCTRESPPPTPKAGPPAAAAGATSAPSSTTGVTVASEAAVIALAGRPIAPKGKVKDALGPGGWKVNLYEDSGDAQADRVKIDRQRDETWDEAWTHKEGRWFKDDTDLVWGGSGWVSASAPAAAATPGAPLGAAASAPAAAAAPAAPADPLLGAAQRLLGERASGAKAKDLLGGRGPKVNAYDDDGDGHWDRAKVDLDRDDRWDEKWTVKNGQLERRPEQGDGPVWLFLGGAWVPKR